MALLSVWVAAACAEALSNRASKDDIIITLIAIEFYHP